MKLKEKLYIWLKVNKVKNEIVEMKVNKIKLNIILLKGNRKNKIEIFENDLIFTNHIIIY